ncbi:MAG: sugar phosphate nucleotidyltransferase [Patescibacteria group bacterium]
MIKGVILAGGRGTRLWPITKVVSKNLLPVGNQPVIYYPAMMLKNAGIRDILVVCGSEHTQQYMEVFGSGKEFGVHFSYTIQREPGGIAQGLGLAKFFADGNPVALILGDNIFGDDLLGAVKKFSKTEKGSVVALKEVPDPKRFGVASFNKDGTIKNIIEKPKKPDTNWAVTGFYLYDNRVFDVIKTLKPSARGEYEITDVNNFYIKEGAMEHFKTKKYWVDAGTFDSLHLANLLVRKNNK